MPQSYSDENAAGATRPRTGAPPPASDGDIAVARQLIAQLIHNADAELLVRALLAERAPRSAPRARPPATPPPAGAGEPPARPAAPAGRDLDPAVAELARVRRQLMLGQAYRESRHDLNNPLTALLAEAQLLQMEARSAEHRDAAARIVELARRIVALTRRVDDGHPAGGG